MSDSTLNRFLARGTNAARIAFTPSPPTPASGPSPTYIWFATDTSNTYAWDGAAWQLVNNASGSVTTTGSPANGNLTKFSAAGTITNGDLSGDITTSGTLAATIANDAVTYAKIQNVSAASKLLGRGSAGGSGDTEEITLGTGLTMSGTTLSAPSGYEAGPVTAPTSADLATWDNQGTSTVADGTGAMIIKPQVDGLPHGRYKAAPGTPYDVYCRVEINYLSTAAITTAVITSAGIMFKDTGGDNERLTFGTYLEKIAGDEQDTQGALCQRYTGAAPPVLSASPILKYNGKQWPWHRVNNDGTTLTYYVSVDGKNWIVAGTETLAAFIDGAASYGVFALASANATEAQAVITYFSTTAPA